MTSPKDQPPEDHQPGADNVVPLPIGKERARLQAEKEKTQAAHITPEPFFKSGPLLSLPPVTKFMIGIFLTIHILTDVILNQEQQFWTFMHFGFVPGYYTGVIPFGWAAIVGPVTFTFLHGSWTHIILNGFMMMAFGTGTERWMGGKRLLVFFMFCNIFAALAQFAFSPFSTAPVIGASGGLSGLFAAVLLMMQQQDGLGSGNRHGIFPFICLWIVISIVFGMMGGPGDTNVAWAAHIGGFLAGFVIYKPLMRSKLLN